MRCSAVAHFVPDRRSQGPSAHHDNRPYETATKRIRVPERRRAEVHVAVARQFARVSQGFRGYDDAWERPCLGA